MSEDIKVTDGTILEALNNKVDLDGGNYKGSELEAYIHEHCSGLNERNITNCITEIPNKIKLEFNNGTLTLKAGSIVTVPNGVGVFNETTIESDITSSAAGVAGYRLLFCKVDTKSITNVHADSCYSGDVAPSGTTYQMWYNTSENRLYIDMSKTGNWTLWQDGTLPIARLISDGTKITSIDQIFNGIGYIGSHIWVDKGVKFLSPNGRNEDGTLKSTELTTTQLRTFTRALNSTSPVWLTTGSIAISGGISYDPVTNFVVVNNGAWIGACEIGLLTDKNGVIKEFKPKLPFRAVDYSDALLKRDKAEITTWGMPDYSRVINYVSGVYSTNPITLQYNAFIEFYRNGAGADVGVNFVVTYKGVATTHYLSTRWENRWIFPIPKGASVYTGDGNTVVGMYIYPVVGE